MGRINSLVLHNFLDLGFIFEKANFTCLTFILNQEFQKKPVENLTVVQGRMSLPPTPPNL